ncbi:MAG TPA: phosphate ABC transporter substrate-binding protein PstS, partial [Lacipirellulaceae bacterium]|nr:phosphate ABC transporter substrate-binding protein PstS [Lacipirellulaceae bacterium]
MRRSVRGDISGSSRLERVAGRRALLVCAIVLVLIPGCRPSASGKVRLQGAGATFPAPFYKRLVVVYQGSHPDVLIDYQSFGSGGGIQAITAQTVHFCGSDAPLNEKELQAVGGKDAVVEFPSCAGGVVPTYNLPNLKGTLNFTGQILAEIYTGKMSRWNDPAMAKVNPDVQLPDLAITPVWRTDGSGTTYIYTN